ncbi:MAG: hypothetical protein JWO12_604 [Frankiales bacterium]|nr:hypothetical protein [Frankiales bacterium]
MGRLRDELTEPWGILVAGLAGGLAGVGLAVPTAAAVGIGAAVYGVKVLLSAAYGPSEEEKNDRRALAPAAKPAYGTPAAIWLKRAETAVKSLDELAKGAAVTATDVAASHAAEEADAILTTMRRLGGQSVAVSKALAQAESKGLDQEALALRQAANAHPDDASAQQSASAVADRVAVRDRLRKVQASLDGRLQSSALGLEGLLARVAELQATAASAGEIDPSASDLASLTTEVEGLRVGLADAEQAARTALGSPG